MKTTHLKRYSAPWLYAVAVAAERGFGVSDGGFEQPEFGGEDNL